MAADVGDDAEIYWSDLAYELRRRYPDRVPSATAASAILSALNAIITDALLAGQAIDLRGLGKLRVKDVRCQPSIPAAKNKQLRLVPMLRFKPSPTFKARLRAVRRV